MIGSRNCYVWHKEERGQGAELGSYVGRKHFKPRANEFHAF